MLLERFPGQSAIIDLVNFHHILAKLTVDLYNLYWITNSELNIEVMATILVF